MRPRALSQADLSEQMIAREREIVTEQTKNDNAGKPDNIIAKIVDGRMKSAMAEMCLLDQPFVMESSKSVGQFAKDAGISITKMHHWVLGK